MKRFHDVTIQDLRTFAAADDYDALLSYCETNDANGDFDELDIGDLLAICEGWEEEQACGWCHKHIGLGASNDAWRGHGNGICAHV